MTQLPASPQMLDLTACTDGKSMSFRVVFGVNDNAVGELQSEGSPLGQALTTTIKQLHPALSNQSLSPLTTQT